MRTAVFYLLTSLLVVPICGMNIFHPVATVPTTHSLPSLPDEVAERLRTRIEAEKRGLNAFEVEGQRVHATKAVPQFYEQRGFTPAWIDSEGPRPIVDSLLAALGRASREGLRAEDYHIHEIETLVRRMRGGSEGSDGPRPATDLELLCTDAFLLYGSHLLTGRVSPTTIQPTWTLQDRRADLVQLLRETVDTGTVSSAFASLRPTQPEYQALIQARSRYRRIAEQGGWPTIPDGPTLRAGDESSRIQALRDRLRAEPKGTDLAAGSNRFDANLERAVLAFQERHGLDPDGIVGPATRQALNVSAEDRITHLDVNLERWRWLPQDLGTRHVLVNIAAFHLRVVEHGEDVLEMRVIAGTPYRQTPVFSADISYLVFNPYWHVPPRLATRDKLPEFQRNPALVEQQQFDVLQGWGADAKRIDPASIDWPALSPGAFPYRLRQRPGPHNALGQVKFMFPNSHNVYLHDTPARGLFARTERSFSSGCIRVAEPLQLAAYLLTPLPGWTPERIRTSVGKDTELTVVLREKVPVHLLYWTAWADEEGTVHFRRDVYSRDGDVARALAAAPPVR